MDLEYTTEKVPDKLTERIQASGSNGRFRRRAVLTKGNTRWELVCCTVEGILPGEIIPEPVPSRRYRQAILYEDFLTTEECLKFAHDLQDGNALFGDIDLLRGQNAQWTTELLPVSNDYMDRAGCVISLLFAQNGGRASVRTLLSADQPYYPDVDDATRDWLPLRIYHGHSDARNDHVLFLLPETRAFMTSAEFSETGTLDISIAGTEVGALSLLVKGAFWEGKSLHHVEASVEGGKAALVMPDDADRFEYYLIDREAVVYDFHREDRFSQLRQNQKMPGSLKRTLEDQVRKACQSGEGFRAEFKPFIDLSDKHAPKEDMIKRSQQNAKLREVVESVAAFANAEGGHIFFGVNADCTISGIGERLREWASEGLSESTIERYFGALKSKIKDFMHGEVTLNVSHVEIDGMLVGILEIPAAAHGPVALQQEFHLYVRSGASNRKAPPEQWPSILKPGKPHGLF